MMLNSLMLSLQNVSAESPETGENPLLALSQDGVDLTASNSPFAAMLAELNIDLPEGEFEDQDLSALLAEIAEQMGESLPLAVDGMPVENPLESESIPADMTREQLISFLMANAGTGSHEATSRDLDIELASGLDLEPAEELLDSHVAEMVTLSQSSSSLSDDQAELLDSEESIDVQLTELDVSEENVNDSMTTVDKVALVESDTENEGVGHQPLTPKLAVKEATEETVETEEENSDLAEGAEQPDTNISAAAKDISEASAKQASAVAAPVIEGEIKNQVKGNQIRNGVTSVANADSVSAQDSAISQDDATSQSTSNSKLNASQAVPNETDALLKSTLENQNAADEAELDVDVETELKPLGTLAVDQKSASKSQGANLTAAQLSEHLNRPVKLSNAAQGMAERISTMVAGEIKHAVIQLDPAELGHVEVRLQVQNDQTQIQIVSASQQVRDALEQQSARLREALNNQGMNLTQLDVSDRQESSQYQGQGFGQSADQANESDGEFDGADSDAEVVINQNVGLVSHFV